MEPSKPVALPLKAGAETPVAGGGEPPYDGNMEHRITFLEARWDAIFPTLATKADLIALGADLRVEFREGLSQNAMKIEAVRTEMQKLSADIKTWTLATVLTIIGTMLAALIGVSQVQKATPPAPIIITLPAAK